MICRCVVGRHAVIKLRLWSVYDPSAMEGKKGVLIILSPVNIKKYVVGLSRMPVRLALNRLSDMISHSSFYIDKIDKINDKEVSIVKSMGAAIFVL